MAKRKYIRIWTRGYYRNTRKIGKNGHPIRKWCKGYFRKVSANKLFTTIMSEER